MRRNLLKMTVATGALLLASCNPASSPDIPPMNALTALTGATLTDMQRAYDVQHYTIDVGVYPETKRIDGSVAVRFTALEPLSALELDLDPRMAVTAATRGDAALSFTHDSHKVTVQLDAPLAAGETATVTLTYGGKPHIGIAPPWQGGLVWSTTEDGLPWVATAVQGEGCDLWWPCKDHYADKPDAGMDIIINVPDTVKVAANGVLAGQSDIKDGRHSFHWKTNHPITGYAAAINIGPYTRLTDSYVGINGTTMPIEFWVLPEDAQAAETLITSDIKSDLAFFEKLLGPYPWGDEKVGFVQTPHLGMEHQTINAYGADFPRECCNENDRRSGAGSCCGRLRWQQI